MSWSVDKPLGTFLKDVHGEGESDAESDELGSVTIFKDKEKAVERVCDDEVVCQEPKSSAEIVQAGRSDGAGGPEG